MPKIIDTLIATKAHTANFTVNLAAADKRVLINNSTSPCFMINSSSKFYFQPGDNLLLLTAGYYIPESFVTTETVLPFDPIFPALQLTIFDAGGLSHGYLPGLGDLGSILLPFENFEGVYNIYSDINSLYNATKFKLSGLMLFHDTEISMINVPADLNGKNFYIYPFIKILHSLPMVL